RAAIIHGVITLAKFSIILPAHNPETSLASISSLREQSHSDWICYVIDETPAHDAEKSIVAKAQDKRVRPAPGGPGGLDTVAKMMNWATKATDSEFILPLPEGIVLKPEALERYAAAFAKNANAAVVFSSYAETGSDGKPRDIKLYPHEGAFHER